MKNKNYALKFALSLTLFILLPLLIVLYIIIVVCSIALGEMHINEIYKPILVLLLSVGISFILTYIIGFIVYKVTKFQFNKRENLTISNGTIEIRVKDIILIKARKFMFLYSFDIYSKPFKHFSSMTFYFNNRQELIDFVNGNKELLYEFIRESDLEKLGLK